MYNGHYSMEIVVGTIVKQQLPRIIVYNPGEKKIHILSVNKIHKGVSYYENWNVLVLLWKLYTKIRIENTYLNMFNEFRNLCCIFDSYIFFNVNN